MEFTQLRDALSTLKDNIDHKDQEIATLKEQLATASQIPTDIADSVTALVESSK